MKEQGTTSHRRRRGRVLAAIAALTWLILTVACTTATGTTGAATGTTTGTGISLTGNTSAVTATTPSGGPFEIKTEIVSLVDRTRITEAGSKTPEKPDRTLDTHLFVPQGPGPFPLIVFSHGLWGHPTKFTKLLSAWARAGFVVAAPAFPLTNDTVPGAAGNWTGLAQQPADVRFVIDQMLQLDSYGSSPVARKIKRDRVGVGGLSLGGATTYAVGFNDCCRDPRIKAVEVLSAMRLAVGGDYVLDGHVPLLIMHGTKDAALPYSNAVDAFATSKSPVWFVTLERGTHAPPFEDDVTEWDSIAEQTTTDFWLGTLAENPDALTRVESDATVANLASIQKK